MDFLLDIAEFLLQAIILLGVFLVAFAGVMALSQRKRGAGFQKRFYSTLAGFMEPGETCEDAVIREVREEVGIEVGNVRYFSSQPWPFPSQVMLGFFAEWQSGDLVLNPDEIEDADWFDISAMPPTPPSASISGQLISHFIESF